MQTAIMSLTTSLCALLLLLSSSSAEIFNKSWWNSTVFYQVYPKSFYDSNGDGVGDLNGITLKLQYVKNSGINAIWLSPIFSSPMADGGYDISNFTEIAPIFGTLEDFEKLVMRAHKLGLKVVLDFVPNHTSDQHPWFQKALQGDEKYKEYYIWADGKNKDDKTPPNNWLSLFNIPAWTYVPSLKQWYLHQFGTIQPDLNYSNPEVVEEMRNALKFWLDKGVDGFRVDSAPYIFEDKELRDEPRSYAPDSTPDQYTYLEPIYTADLKPTYELFGSWRKYLDGYADERNLDQKMLVMETYSSLEHTLEYYDYDVLPFNFLFITNVTNSSTATDFKNTIDLWINSVPYGKSNNWVLGNHDRPRVASRFPGRLDQMTMLSMILPGMAVTYNGDEIGMVDDRNISWADTQDPLARIAGKDHYAAISRDPERTPFQWSAEENAGFSTANSTWLPVNPNYKTLNLQAEERSYQSHYKIYKTLAYLHRKEPALTQGSYASFTTNNGTVLGVIRSSDDRTVLLLINFDDYIPQFVDLSDQDLPKQLKLQVSCFGTHSSPKQRVNIDNIYLPEKAAVVYTSLNIQ
ncbi:maltase 2-like [Camponotus floridanus]|uniref:maltase 2-like n=2 Tax=Camponotus floridanus TaxID=104421 RepID=UPI000DC6B1F0|nr:maltase 2-like isoform X1 [Camponotus floridanus]XP_025263096.1 maltase 2-like [Camponotus floridanus]